MDRCTDRCTDRPTPALLRATRSRARRTYTAKRTSAGEIEEDCRVPRLPLRSAARVLVLAWTAMLVPDVGSAQSEKTVRCEAQSRETVRCKADTRGGVVLQRQLSRAGCWYDETWGYDARGIWVSNGCRADFAVGRRTADLGVSDSTPPPASPQSGSSDSSDPADGGSGISGKDVAIGAGAALVIGALAYAVLANRGDDDEDDDRYDDRRYDDERDDGRRSRSDPWGRDQIVRCESEGKKERYCRVDTRRGVELYRQHSKSRCRYGSSWGYDRRGIWVDNGCRADFLIRG
jgi:hypothetical protein